MSDILDTLKYLVNKEVEEILFAGNVSSLDPLQVKLSNSDDAINVKMLNIFGIKLGSNVLMIKYLNKFIIVGVIVNSPINNYCMLVRSTTQSIPNATHTPLNFSTGSTSNDPSSMFDGTDLITIPQTGIYQVNANARFQDSTTSTIRIMNMYVNAVQVASVAARPDANGRYGVNFNLNYEFTEGDQLQITVFHATGSAINIGTYDSTYLNVLPLNFK